MPSYFILVPILLPVIAGILLLVFPIEDARKRNICIEIIVVHQYTACLMAADTPSV